MIAHGPNTHPTQLDDSGKHVPAGISQEVDVRVRNYNKKN